MSLSTIEVTLKEGGVWYAMPLASVRMLTELLSSSSPLTEDGFPIFAIRMPSPCGDIIWDVALKTWRPQ